ncbi:uncharacterized protein TNCV_1699471 [Trichonephila clavipes]|nr:uncharacterized protein TNCV_4570411 [Trichonephila clavipes]GFW11069.1 uncharacterized protein TNCV_276011 [Trichonephila clavipes]GFX57395.1 uncharacterized protein TNCV_3138141 [Trichonephila clavipes]GFX82828.1 uncharacterized protein TNCV_1699471 [Trichonephila clavipes]
MANHKCSTSYGIVVKTKCKRIMVLHRKVPYCIQDFFHRLHKKKYPWSSSHSLFLDVWAQFENEWLPTMRKHELEDYKRYLKGEYYEDLYDFPHGQLRPKPKEDISTIELFYVAYREFQEETGFHFKFTKEEIEQYPLITLQYTGLDGSLYKQNYFIVNDVRGLKRHVYFNSFNKSSTVKRQITSWNDDRLIYESLLLPIEVAYRKFSVQQKMRSDLKHLLCSNYLERLYDFTLLDEDKENE